MKKRKATTPAGAPTAEPKGPHPCINQGWLVDLKHLATLRNDEGTQLESNLLERFPEACFPDAHYLQLIALYSTTLSMGLFTIANGIRAHTEDSVIRGLEGVDRRSELRLAVERDDLNEGRRLRKQLPSRDGTSKAFDFFLEALGVKSPRRFPIPGQSRQRFAHFIEGRDVAIVGPSHTEQPDGSEIDSHDVVVRMNYHTPTAGQDAVKGARCDVTSFNVPQVKTLLGPESSGPWGKSIQWMLVNQGKTGRRLRKHLKRLPADRRPTRLPRYLVRAEYVNELCLNGSFTALPKLVLNILHGRPRSVRIYHADLMLTVDRTSGYVPDDWNWNNRKHAIFLDHCARKHDPLPQLFLLQNLFRRGLIDGDQRFEEVMSLDRADYMAQLQMRYGDAGRTHPN